MNGGTAVSSVADGITRIALPTPFIVGRVNVYVIEGNPLTLVDTGPNSGSSLDELERGLASIGSSIDRIGRLVITHQHVDHAGLASIIQSRSGASVEMLSGLAPLLADWPAAADRDDELAGSLLSENGLDEDMITALGSAARIYRSFGCSIVADRTYDDGEQVEIGGHQWTVAHRPGHSPSDTVLHDPTRKLLIGGDHLLERISSNPLISAPLPGDTQTAGRPRPLPTYLAHLATTRSMEIELVLPGHGDPFSGHRDVIDERFTMHERRAAKLLGYLGDGPATAFELARLMWGRLAVSQSFLALSEVLGHMDLLVDQGAVDELERDANGVVRFAAA